MKPQSRCFLVGLALLASSMTTGLLSAASHSRRWTYSGDSALGILVYALLPGITMVLLTGIASVLWLPRFKISQHGSQLIRRAQSWAGLATAFSLLLYLPLQSLGTGSKNITNPIESSRDAVARGTASAVIYASVLIAIVAVFFMWAGTILRNETKSQAN